GPALAATARGSAVGLHTGELRVGTGLADLSELRLPYSLRVRGTLEVDPSTPYFDLRNGKQPELTLSVASRPHDFRLLYARVSDGPFRATLRAAPDGKYEVKLSFLAERAAPDQRGTASHLLLVSNDRSEPRKQIALFAFRPPALQDGGQKSAAPENLQ